MKNRPPTGTPPDQALLQLLRAADTIWNASRVFFERWGLSPSQFNVMNLLHARASGLSQTELGRQLIMHRSNVTGLVDRLERRGLVERQEVAGDRRAYRVVLTATGNNLLNEILPQYYEAAGELWTGLHDKVIVQMMAALEKVSHNAQTIAAGTGHSHNGKAAA